jgi:hypothetical protein
MGAINIVAESVAAKTGHLSSFSQESQPEVEILTQRRRGAEKRRKNLMPRGKGANRRKEEDTQRFAHLSLSLSFG